jgi:hypothetical protein
MRCDDVADRLSDVADGSVVLDRPARRHVDRCLHCQAELVQYRKLLRALHNLRTEVLDPAPGLLADILSAVELAGERRAARSMMSGRRMAYVGGIAAAATAGAAGAILIAARTRKSGRFRLAG